jgi:hypothetical protein
VHQIVVSPEITAKEKEWTAKGIDPSGKCRRRVPPTGLDARLREAQANRRWARPKDARAERVGRSYARPVALTHAW